MTEAEKLATTTFVGAVKRWSFVRIFRRFAELGLPHAAATILAENMEFATRVRDDPSMDRYFSDRAAVLEAAGGLETFARSVTNNQEASFRAAVDGASLVYGHSIIDAAALDYCKICSLVAPDDFMPMIEKKQATVKEIVAEGADGIKASKIGECLSALEKVSLVKKTDMLFRLCKPEDDLKLKEYVFDRDRLEALDKKRHGVVHGSGPVWVFSGLEEDLDYLRETTFFLFHIVNLRYGVKLDPQMMASGSTG